MFGREEPLTASGELVCLLGSGDIACQLGTWPPSATLATSLETLEGVPPIDADNK